MDPMNIRRNVALALAGAAIITGTVVPALPSTTTRAAASRMSKSYQLPSNAVPSASSRSRTEPAGAFSGVAAETAGTAIAVVRAAPTSASEMFRRMFIGRVLLVLGALTRVQLHFARRGHPDGYPTMHALRGSDSGRILSAHDPWAH
jgi:hypothetical protein